MSRFQALVPPKGIEITIELNALGYHQEVHGTMGPSIFQVFQSQHILKVPNSKALHYILPTYNGKEYTLLFQKKKCRNIVRKYWNKVRPKLSMTTPKSCSSMFGVRGLSWLHHPTTPLCCLQHIYLWWGGATHCVQLFLAGNWDQTAGPHGAGKFCGAQSWEPWKWTGI